MTHKCNPMTMAINDGLIHPAGQLIPGKNKMYSELPFLKRICPLTGNLYWRQITHCPFDGEPL